MFIIRKKKKAGSSLFPFCKDSHCYSLVTTPLYVACSVKKTVKAGFFWRLELHESSIRAKHDDEAQ